MSEDLIIQDSPRKGVVRLRLNRPEKRNAMSIPLLESLIEKIESAHADEANRILVLCGSGKVFCAGLDLAEATDKDRAHRSGELVAQMLRAIGGSRLITIAQVHGAAVAGGAGMMSACDLSIAAQGTRIGYPEVHRGLVAGLVMHFIVRQVPLRIARELLLTGELIDADRAREVGLVNRVVPADDLESAVDALIDPLLQAGPEAQQRTKRLLDKMAPGDMTGDLEVAITEHLDARNSAEAAEGLAAFLEKRKPRWQL